MATASEGKEGGGKKALMGKNSLACIVAVVVVVLIAQAAFLLAPSSVPWNSAEVSPRLVENNQCLYPYPIKPEPATEDVWEPLRPLYTAFWNMHGLVFRGGNALNCNGPALQRLRDLVNDSCTQDFASHRKLGIVSVYLPPKGLDTLGKSGKNHEAYAARHGYQNIMITREDQISAMPRKRIHLLSHRGWAKIAVVIDLLDRKNATTNQREFEWLVWLDHDALFMNFAVSLDFLTGLPQHDLILSADRNGINSGIFLVRNTPWSRDFFRKVWNTFPSTRLWPGSEQETLIARLGDGSDLQKNYDEIRDFGGIIDQDRADLLASLLGPECCRQKVLITPQCVLNAYPTWVEWSSRKHNVQYRRGNLVVHFAGQKNKSDLMTQFNDPETGTARVPWGFS